MILSIVEKYWKNIIILSNLLFIHIGGLLISAIIEFSTATMSAVSKDQFFIKVNSSLHESILHYHMNFEIQNEFNNLQMNLGCCGASSFRDYLKLHSETPSSCKPTSYGFGCVLAITRYIQQYIMILMYLCFIFAILKGIYIILSILLFRKTVGKENSSV
ncbi:unnamed protein product [Schistosoma spindalis]|nr:unnamed protein product [Schistosoma spindale]